MEMLTMERNELLLQLKGYIAKEILEGQDVGLDFDSPLLEWGVINSFEIVKLVKYIKESFEVDIPGDRIVADSFQNLEAIADLVISAS